MTLVVEAPERKQQAQHNWASAQPLFNQCFRAGLLSSINTVEDTPKAYSNH